MPLHRSTGDSDTGAHLQPPPSVSRVYDAAARYETALQQAGLSKISLTENGDEGFGDLMSPHADSDDDEDANTLYYAHISATGESWIPHDSEDSSLSEEPESPVSEGSERFDTERYEKDLGDAVSLHEAELESWKLPPKEIVQLLVDEFSPLAEGDEEEELLAETEGALRQEILILGVAHLTTHRLAFHASLLSEEQSEKKGPIKAGPVYLHKRGWWSKRRVWMSLSANSISVYPSSKDEDQIKPLRTTLLSSIKELLPVNEKYPKVMHIVFESPTLKTPLEGIAEWDTVESAQEWRKELNAAIFLHRRRRRDAMASSGDDNGVRLSIPLSRITDVKLVDQSPGPHTISVEFRPTSSDSVTGQDPRNEPEVFTFVTKSPGVAWESLAGRVAAIKVTKTTTSPPVVIDFGPMHFLERKEKNSLDIESRKERAVRMALALGFDNEIWMARARLFRSICAVGFFVISPTHVGFWSKSLTGQDVRYRLRLNTIRKAKLSHVKHPGSHGLALEIEGQADLKFDFKSDATRDEALVRVTTAVENQIKYDIPPSPMGSSFNSTLAETDSSGEMSPVSPTSSMVSHSRSATQILSPLRRTSALLDQPMFTQSLRLKFPKAINHPPSQLAALPPTHFVVLTIGSRGDVQPYIALGMGLKREGHRYTIITHEEYKPWVESFGLDHRTAGGDPGALMKLSVENNMMSPEFIRDSITIFRPWLEELLKDSWEQCHDAEVLIESPSAMAGVHIAEALHIPYFRAFTMPWTKTAEFPHAFMSPPVDAPSFNRASYVLFTNLMWAASSGQINRWRKTLLNLPATDMNHLAQSKIPFIYNFSPAVVPKPLDWSDATIVSGYWFLDNPDPDWEAPQDLLDWMAKARADQKPIVYIGFGSIPVPDSNKMTRNLVNAVLKSDVRAIISKGWSDRMSKTTEPPVILPPECYGLDKVPHDWLFPQVDAALHHGGAGTTGASLRAGIPTLIKPWFGDQWFWASRVQKLGAGLKVLSLSVNDLSNALTKATTSRIMKEKAASVGERIRAENGVNNAITALYTYLPRASVNRKSL